MDTLVDLPCPDPDAARRGITVAAADLGPAPLLCARLDDGREVPIERTVRVGAAAGNDLVIEDRFVSGVHCALVRHGGRTLVKDLGSRNGCWLGGTRVRLAELVAGARLTLGGTTLRVVAAAGVAPLDAGMPGDSPAMVRLRRELLAAAPTGLAILLVGESGSGKELAARAVHEASGRRGGLVAVNCGALSPEVVESELFGHERGAFTGAAGRRAGLFVEADGGTLFLDEIGEMAPGLQPKLLRVLETGLVRAVGGTGERRVDVRVVAATHRDLPAAIEQQRFRLDLYHRLSAIEIRLPPLRERREDIAALARHFLDETGLGGSGRSFSPAALLALSQARWPGNVRELRNAVVRAAHFGARTIEPVDLFPQRPASSSLPAADAGFTGGFSLVKLQRSVIEQALREHGGRVRPAARALGMPPSTLHDRVRRWRRGEP